jgi:hypothetical protein
VLRELLRAGQEWGSCKGSRENSRGFTCGLWLLLHTLAARSRPEDTGGAFWMTAVRLGGFIACSVWACVSCAG